MTKAEYLEKLSEYERGLVKEDKKGSTGSIGKLAGEIIGRAILVKGVNADKRVGCRKSGEKAVVREGYGVIGIKTGSSPVAYGHNFTKDDICEDNILPSCDYVCWAPFTKFLTKENLPSMTWVFTRDKFIDTLKVIGKNGLQSSIKVSKDGRQLNIQVITLRMEDRLWDILENLPTVAEEFAR